MKVQDFYNILKDNNVNCFCGVPDSLLKSFCAYITDNAENHTITANEGNAIGLAAGHYLATGNIACVYMQNSGIGNCVNPLLSLTDEEVYNIPLLMIIGWRGEPNKKDEPQHVKQGKVTDKLLEVMGIEYEVLPENFEEAKPIIQKSFDYMKNTLKPFAFIIKKDLFDEYKLINKTTTPYTLGRELAIETVLKRLNESDIVISTTGHISREVYETREKYNQTHKQDFLTVGSMGHSSSIALGIALSKPERDIYCFDGDGAFLMHQGALIVNASKKLKNFKHIIFNNEAHGSVGAQPTAVGIANISQIAYNSGYNKVYTVSTIEQLEETLNDFISQEGTSLLEIKCTCSARTDLGRPKEKPFENKRIFMNNLKQIEFCYNNSITNLSKILEIEKVKKALVFTGKNSFEKIRSTVEKELNNTEVYYFNNFSTNPKKEEVDRLIKELNFDFDIIIAIGGGSVIDFAKAYRYYSRANKKIIAIPTTFGTGAESTQFAVIYENGVKKSLDNSTILPEYTIVDAQFAKFNSKYLKACTAMDTYCQAIESYWAVKSTNESQEYAKEAIKLCRDNIVNYVNSNSSEAEENMAIASHLSGMAINISRTTAAHALSYKITSDYNIPHGHAVALSMADLFVANQKICKNDCYDTRGVEYVCDRINEILSILNVSDFKKYWFSLMNTLALEYNFDRLNISNKTDIINAVNIERLKNNPKNIKEDLPTFWKQ